LLLLLNGMFSGSAVLLRTFALNLLLLSVGLLPVAALHFRVLAFVVARLASCAILLPLLPFALWAFLLLLRFLLSFLFLPVSFALLSFLGRRGPFRILPGLLLLLIGPRFVPLLFLLLLLRVPSGAGEEERESRADGKLHGSLQYKVSAPAIGVWDFFRERAGPMCNWRRQGS
jgi:hypothetical protein